MSWDRWSTDKKLIDRISRSIVSGSVSHAYIIEGDSQCDKLGFAKEFLKAVNCLNAPGIGCDSCISCRKIDHDNCEDLYVIEAEYNSSKSAKSVRDEAIENLQDNLSKRPNGARNMAIICDADTMTARAQNRLLKTLEEPAPGTVIILLSENKENLLQTIKSRCIAYRLNGLDDLDMDTQGMACASELTDAVLNLEKFRTMKLIITKNIKNKDDALELLDGMERIFRNIMLAKDKRFMRMKREKVFTAIQYIEEARQDIFINVNYRYALKNMVIKLTM